MSAHYIIWCVHYISLYTHYLVCTIYLFCADIIGFSEYMILICPYTILFGTHIIIFFSYRSLVLFCHYQWYVDNIIVGYAVEFEDMGHSPYQVRSWSKYLQVFGCKKTKGPNSIDKTGEGHRCLFLLFRRWISQVYWPLVQLNLVISK